MSVCGAEFRKSDLQIHSPRDRGWEGLRPEDLLGGNPTPEEIKTVREEYCKRFIDKCQTEGLRAIAITDHHEGIYCYTFIETKAKMEQENGPIDLWIFPGMELSCKDSSQAIIIFDSDLPQPLFEKARSIMGLPTNCVPLSREGIVVELLDHNIEEIQPLLEADGELYGRFIVLPHVKPGGHKTVLRTGFHKRFKDMPYVGGYMDRCYPHELHEGGRRILDGAIPAWGCEKRGVISTSDARHSDCRLIGNHASWIKLASPTAESIRQAMLAPDSRIRYEEPRLPDVVINKLTVQGASYIENGEYFFNPQMNSLIGGRGAGKSSLLEYIRFALGCSAIDGKDAQDETTLATLRMREMLHNTLSSEGKIIVDILLNGVPVIVSRAIINPKFIQIETEEQITNHNAEDVIKLIPIQAFRQGELSDFGTEQLSNRLLELVTANASDILGKIERDFRSNGQQISEALAKAVRLSAARQRKVHLETELKLLQAQIQSVHSQLEPSILQESSVIADHKKYISEQRNIQLIRETIQDCSRNINKQFSNLTDSLLRLIKNHPELELGELTEFYALISSQLSNDSSSDQKCDISAIDNLIANYFGGLLSTIRQAEEEWTRKVNEHNQIYEEEKKTLIGQQKLMELIEDLSSKVKQVDEELEKATSYEQELRTADEVLQALRSSRRELFETLIATVEEQILTIDEKSSHLARGELSPLWDFSEVEASIRSILAIPSIREKRIEDTINIVESAEDPISKWNELLDELLALVKWQEGASKTENTPPDTPLLLSVLDVGFLEKLQAIISSDRVATALRVVIRPKVNIYQQRQDGEIEFRKASQGEQAATLLNILMNQSRGLLIIDQPEEDLDNTIINDIIKTIRKTKDDRQLIISTHNANIVVNGDSELVIEMYLGQNRASGAIDETAIRDAVTLTMEGGKDAFELRRKKYNF